MIERDLVVVGAGGFGREVLDVALAVFGARPGALRVRGVLDDAPHPNNLQRLRERDTPWLGTVDEYILDNTPGHYVIGIGDPRIRAILSAKFDARGWQAATLIHPSATLGFDVSLGEGTIVCPGARLSTHLLIGRHVHVNANATIGHDVTIGDHVSINPMVAISGDVTVEYRALLGVSSNILQGLTIGHDAVVGGSACVTRDVAPRAVVKGVPAR